MNELFFKKDEGGIKWRRKEKAGKGINEYRQEEKRVRKGRKVWWRIRKDGECGVPSLPGLLWPGLVALHRVLSMGQIGLNCVLKLNNCLK